MGASPLGVPTGSPGSNANALSQVRMAIDMLHKVLPDLPIGSKPYEAVLAAVQGMSRIAPAGDANAGVQQTSLRNMQQNAQQSGMLQSLMRSLGGGAAGGPGPPGAGAPAASPGGGLPPGGPMGAAA